jgi:mono/diheme cytochrome c family protein
MNRAKKLTVTLLAIIALAMVFMFPAPSRAIGTADDAAKLYQSKCASCHGPDGSSNTPVGKKMKAPDLRSADVLKKTDDQLVEAIARGKLATHKFEKSLGQDQIRQLVAHLRQLAKKS